MQNNKFEEFFGGIYKGRWPELREALVRPERQVLRRNKFVEPTSLDGLAACDFLKNCFWRPDSFALKKNAEGYYNFYVQDPASVIVANALKVKPGSRVLDLCAAPGGKSLILAEQLLLDENDRYVATDSELISNEMSDARRERLVRVIHEYIPRDQRNEIFVKGSDGNQYGLRYANHFDFILADVPCSGERHLLENASEFELWTEKRTKNLAVRQHSLLSAAWFACKPGGRIVYSTCSISPFENDAVVAKLLKKRKPKILRDLDEQFDFLEETEHGYQILPDRCGFGPMYFSIIQKV